MHIALLRAVNLAGRNAVSMADARAVLTKLGLQDVRTLLQSGNVVFRADRIAPAQLEPQLEAALQRGLGWAIEVFVRSAKEWAAIVERNPFPDEAARDPGHLLVMTIKRAPTREAVAGLQKSILGREVVRPGRRELYITYPDGVGRSRLTTAVIERALDTRGTARNWNTVLKLAQACDR